MSGKKKHEWDPKDIDGMVGILRGAYQIDAQGDNREAAINFVDISAEWESLILETPPLFDLFDPYHVICESIPEGWNQFLNTWPPMGAPKGPLPPGIHGTEWAFSFPNKDSAIHFIGYAQNCFAGLRLWLQNSVAPFTRW